jgi:parallel beta-helix repeat protein
MSGVFGAAIELAGSGIEVSHNRLQQGFNGMLFILPNVNHAVHDNDIQGMGQFGLIAFANALDNSVIAGNRLSDNVVDGLNLQARNSGNRIEKNRADGNGRDGIRSQGASGNVFEANHMRNNTEHDAHDDNRAANTWTGNKCQTDFPSGTICD